MCLNMSRSRNDCFHQTQETIQELLSVTAKHTSTLEGSKTKSPRPRSTSNLESNDASSGPKGNGEQGSSPATLSASEEKSGIARELAAIRATLDEMREGRAHAPTQPRSSQVVTFARLLYTLDSQKRITFVSGHRQGILRMKVRIQISGRRLPA
jgi:hypothetical protein